MHTCCEAEPQHNRQLGAAKTRQRRSPKHTLANRQTDRHTRKNSQGQTTTHHRGFIRVHELGDADHVLNAVEQVAAQIVVKQEGLVAHHHLQQRLPGPTGNATRYAQRVGGVGVGEQGRWMIRVAALADSRTNHPRPPFADTRRRKVLVHACSPSNTPRKTHPPSAQPSALRMGSRS
jgi:hypothetical protein